jgi:hypothetical protein
MPDQVETLRILNKEKNYEEEMAKNISGYCSDSLDYIEELESSQREEIKAHLNKLAQESLKHSRMFEQLIMMVIENGDADY